MSSQFAKAFGDALSLHYAIEHTDLANSITKLVNFILLPKLLNDFFYESLNFSSLSMVMCVILIHDLKISLLYTLSWYNKTTKTYSCT